MLANYFEPHLEYGPPMFKNEFKSENANGINQNAWEYVFGIENMSENEFNCLESLYDAEIKYADYRLGNIMSKLKEKGIYDKSMIILTSDHGENIGDHSLMDHQYSLHQTLLHVPLVIKYPDSFNISVDRVSNTVSTVDIFPTIKTLFNNSEKQELDGRALPPIKSIKNNRYILSEYIAPFPSIDTIKETYPEAELSYLNKYDRSIVAIQNDLYKYVKYSDGEEYLCNKKKCGNYIEEISNVDSVSKDNLFE
jgi:arylsulfatase A-like enzyme